MIYINGTKATRADLARLFDGGQRVRDISIIETPDGVDIQTILNADEIRAEICAFLRRKYQAR